jgi:hypothetical protein
LKSWRNAGYETWSGSPEARVVGIGHEITLTLRAECSLMRQSSSGSFVSALKA